MHGFDGMRAVGGARLALEGHGWPKFLSCVADSKFGYKPGDQGFLFGEVEMPAGEVSVGIRAYR